MKATAVSMHLRIYLCALNIPTDNIPIKYRYWKQKGSEWVVPSSLKNLCWEKLKDLFVFPDGFDEEVAKD